jgi:hypothetical protein
MSVAARRRWIAAVVGALVVLLAAGPAAAGEHSVYGYGDAGFHGSTGFVPLNHPIAGMAPTPSGDGYWVVTREGRVHAFGAAPGHGSVPVHDPARPVVGMAARRGGGYWVAASDGSVFSFGGAPFHGSMGGVRLAEPVVGIAATPTGRGYWLVARDGGIFSFGDAAFHGSTGAIRLNQPIVGMGAVPAGGGYWLVARDGGVFSFGSARFHGSTGAMRLNRSIVGMAPTPTGRGYHLVGADGGVFTFGDAVFRGAISSTEPVVGIAASPSGGGYWLVTTGHVAVSPTFRETEVRFGDGTHAIGADAVRPGTYRVQQARGTCRWENETTGATGVGGLRWVVTLVAGERLTSAGCGEWTSDIFPVTRGWEQPFGDGTWVVSTDVRAGTWRAPGGPECAWARLRSFRFLDTDVVVKGGGAGTETVLIERADGGFLTTGCGTWTKVG